MSSGIQIEAGGRTLAEAATVVASPTRAAVLLLRAAIAGTLGLDDALPRLATALVDPTGRDVAAGRVDTEVEMRWQLAADAVLRVNIERRLLRAALERAETQRLPDIAGTHAVPPPVELAGRTQRDALDACQNWMRTAGAARRMLATVPNVRAEPVRPDGPAAPVVRRWLLRRDAGAAAAYLEGLAAMAVPAHPDLVRALEAVVAGRSGAVPDPVRAAALAELGRAERLAAVRTR